MQRDWRRAVVTRLKARLGYWCRGCETVDALQVSKIEPYPWLELIIPDRRAEDLLPYGNNTVTIYNQILKGKIPLDRVTLLCDECQFKARRENE